MARLIFNFIPMDMGDCIVVSLTDDKSITHTLILDSGTSKSFREYLRPQLKGLYDKKSTINLWVLSHIHDDHIGGFTIYIRDLEYNIVPKTDSFIFNPPTLKIVSGKSHSEGIYVPISISQSDTISDFLTGDDKTWSKAFSGGKFNFNGMEIFVLSPSLNSYKSLLDKNKAHIKMKDGETYTPISVGQYDYRSTIEQLSHNKFEEDKSIENGSSIALLLIYKKLRFLWMSDAYPSVVCESLKRLGYSEENPLECEWATLSHHGSCHNINPEWVNMVRAKKYIVTANGNNKYCLPNKESFARILTRKSRNIKKEKIIFSFTKQGNALDNMFCNELNSFQNYNFEMNIIASPLIINIP